MTYSVTRQHALIFPPA